MGLIAFIIVLLVLISFMYFKKHSSVLQDEPISTPRSPFDKNPRRFRLVIHDGPYSIDLLQKNPNWLYLYEDNEESVGYMRRACIRDEPNSCGIITKHRLGSRDDDFYSDKEQDVTATMMITESFQKLRARIKKYKRLVIPHDLGLENQLNVRAPNLMNLVLNNIFDIAREYDPQCLEGRVGSWLRNQAVPKN